MYLYIYIYVQIFIDRQAIAQSEPVDVESVVSFIPRSVPAAFCFLWVGSSGQLRLSALWMQGVFLSNRHLSSLADPSSKLSPIHKASAELLITFSILP